MGSDMGPSEMVAAAALALHRGWVSDRLILVGQTAVIEDALGKEDLKDHSR